MTGRNNMWECRSEASNYLWIFTTRILWWGGEMKICFNLKRQCRYLQWIIHNHMPLHGLATDFQAGIFFHCSVTGEFPEGCSFELFRITWSYSSFLGLWINSDHQLNLWPLTSETLSSAVHYPQCSSLSLLYKYIYISNIYNLGINFLSLNSHQKIIAFFLYYVEWDFLFVEQVFNKCSKKSIPESSNITTADICIYCNYLEKQRFGSPRADLATASDSATYEVSPEIHPDVFQIALNFHIHI